MPCPHCGKEHPDAKRVCPNTGLPLGPRLICPECGQEARPGARFCAACGATLPPASPPDPGSAHIGETGDKTTPSAPLPPSDPAPQASAIGSTRETNPSVPAGSQSYTRPSVSLVELSRRQTRPSWLAVPTSPRAARQWARQSRLWSFLGYALLILVLLAGAAGLLLLWNQLRPQQAAALFTNIPTASLTNTPLPTATVAVPTTAAPTSLPTQPSTLAPQQPVLLPPTEPATQTSMPSPTASPSPTPTIPAYRLAFYSTRDNQPGIYVMNLDNPEDIILLPLPEGYDLVTWPAFCGDRVAYEVQDRALTLPRWIYRYDLTDKSLQPLELGILKPLRISAPACSPDGRYLAFSAYLDGDWELVVMDTASNEITYRYKASQYPVLGHATWSQNPDVFWWMGTRVSGFYDINETRSYLDNNVGQTRIIAQGKFPAVAPDGSRLAFFCGNLLSLCVASVPSGEILYQIPVSYFKLIDGNPVPATASWSSDGEWLYFTSSITGNWDIYRVRADGSQAQNLTEAWTSDEYMPTAR